MTQTTSGGRNASARPGAPRRRRPTTRATSRPAPARRVDPVAAALDAALDQAMARPEPQVSSFAELGVAAPLVEVLATGGVHAPFAIQTRAMPDALAGRHVDGPHRGRGGDRGVAPTGRGAALLRVSTPEGIGSGRRAVA